MTAMKEGLVNCTTCGRRTSSPTAVCRPCVRAAAESNPSPLYRMAQEVTVLRCARNLALHALRAGDIALAIEALESAIPPGHASWYNGELPPVPDLPPHPITVLRDAA